MSPWIKLLRPHHWVKNGFVFVGLVFGHVWHEPDLVGKVIVVAIAFSAAASTVYIANDYFDRERDRLHPTKSSRPLASGTISLHGAFFLGAVCLLLALGLSALVSVWVLLIVLTYLLLNVGYMLRFKHIVLLDVCVISTGFMLRILAGTHGVGIEPSQWLMLCGMMITLFLGFSKRRAEIQVLDSAAAGHRQVLEDYDLALLDKLIGVCAASTIVSYSLYTMSADTVAVHGTHRLIASVPFVVYGMFRYLFLQHRRSGGCDAAVDLFTDLHLMVACVGWLVTVIAILA